jgi:hypothetical protein
MNYMPSKNYTLFFILSVGFVLISIAFITILGQTSDRDGSNADIRAKATVQNSMQLEGVVESVDLGTIIVNNVKFVDNPDAKPMGTFTVTVPADVRVSPGQSVALSVDAATFNVPNKSFTALAVTPR